MRPKEMAPKAPEKQGEVEGMEGDGFPVLRRNVAGADLGSESHWICAPTLDGTGREVEQFGASTAELERAARWMRERQVESVAIESTGVYWIAPHEVWERCGFEVVLVSTRELSQVPGRKKTDRIDCKWIQRLHSCGLLRGSFRPAEKICMWRTLVRDRGVLAAEQADWVRRMQKSLDQMNVRVHRAVSDIEGTTGMAIIRAIVDGKRKPEELAALRQPGCQKSPAEFVEQLTGNWRDDDLFSLAQGLKMYDAIGERMQAYQEEILGRLGEMERAGYQDQEAPKLKNSNKAKMIRQRGEEPLRQAFYRMIGGDLTSIDGVGWRSCRLSTPVHMRFTNFGLVCATFLSLASLSAQQPAQDPLVRWMDQIAQQQLQRRENAIAEIHSIADAERRKQWVRQTLLSVIGGLPDYNGPLNPRITGRLQSENYVIEKVIFESLPGFYVTANLYRPSQPGRYPGVLLQAGHTQEGKPEGQRLAANLALKGFVVLAFDPVGQGEREQTYDRRVDRPLAGWSVPEHIQAGAQNILIGESVARYFIWDAKRALDYMVSRPEVDPERLGAVGCSGGGALTTFIGALDPRVKAVAPACFINSYRLLFAGPNPDSEMSPPKLLSSGLDMADYIELSAPTPWLILATEGDYFTPAGAKLVYEEARRWFGLYRAADKLRFFVGPGPHGTPLETREAIYEWMIRWLKDGQKDFHEQAVKLYTNAELLVTASGHVDDEPGSRKLYQLISDEFRAKMRQGTIPELLAELRRLNIPSEGTPPVVRVADESSGPEWLRQHIRFESEAGVEIGGELYLPHTSGRNPAVLLVADKASSYWIPSTDSLAETIARTGRVVLELETRDSPGEGERPFVGNWLTNARADQIGRNLPAMRAHDILRGIDLLAARDDVDPSSIRAMARGVKGIWLLLAAAADTRIGKVWLDRTPYSLRAALENSMNTDLFDAVIPGFALHWDLNDLTKAMGDRPVLWTDPANWMGHPVSLGPPFRYRTIIGDTTDLHDDEDNAFLKDFIQ